MSSSSKAVADSVQDATSQAAVVATSVADTPAVTKAAAVATSVVQAASEDATPVVTVIESLTPTFTDAVATYTTIAAAVAQVTSADKVAATSASDSTPTAIESAVETDLGTALVVASGTATGVIATKSSAHATGTATVASSSSTATSGSGDSSSGGSSASKAGIGLGVAAGILLLLVAGWLLWTRRKKQKERMRLSEDDEKFSAMFNGNNTRGANGLKRLSLAPRLSLRPAASGGLLTAANPFAERRQSKGIELNNTSGMTMARSAPAVGPGNDAWNNSTQSHDSNPFETPSERAVSPVSALSREAGQNRLSYASRISAESTPTTASPSTGNQTSLGRQASMNRNGPHALDLTLAQQPPILSIVPPSPAGTEYSGSVLSPGVFAPQTAGAAAIAAAGGPEKSTVHRVQLDFVPSMEDEMPLQVGQLVRLLREYDDGWALCIRLDRSRQGVVPRTCLSVRPLKPRPANGSTRVGPPIKPQTGNVRAAPSHPRPNGRSSPPSGHGSPNQTGRLSPTESLGSLAGSVHDERDFSQHGQPVAVRPLSPAGRSVSPSGQPGMAF